MSLNEQQMHELLYQSIEVEMGGQKIYQKAIECAVTPELKKEFQKYYEETKEHESILRDVFSTVGLDPEKDTPGRQVVRYKAQALVESMDMAKKASPEAGELAAAEAVVEAESKDHQDWELIGKLVEYVDGDTREAFKKAYDQVEEQEDHHLFHTMGWARELWIKSLGLPAVVPPPEEAKSVASKEAAGRAEQQREEMLRKQ